MKTVLTSIAAVTLIVASTGVGYAVQIGDTGLISISRTPDTFTSPGGEFTLTTTGLDLSKYASTTSWDGKFQSFCLEGNESVRNAAVYIVNSTAIAGGTDQATPLDGNDPLSQGSAWLYARFATATLTGYDYTLGSGREASALELQQAIWFLEDEIKTIGNNTFINAVVSKFGSIANAKLDNTVGGFGVYVLNVYGIDPTNNEIVFKQDQMYYIPDGGMSLILLGMGLAGLSAYRRFKKA